MRIRPPLRRSLLGRLLATSVLVAACSIGATAWLAVHTTTQAVQQQQSQQLSADAGIYTQLLNYAATHPNWQNIATLLTPLARTTGLNITLTNVDHQPLATSPNAPAAPTGIPAATVDPLHVDPALSGADADRIDPDVVGPYLLPEIERDKLLALAHADVQCLQNKFGIVGQIVDTPSGRPEVRAINDNRHLSSTACYGQDLAEPTKTEKVALQQLDTLVDNCLAQQHQAPVYLQIDLTWLAGAGDDNNLVQSCVDSGRRTQLAPYAAPAALLFVTGPGTVTTSGFSLSTGSLWRIGGATAAVLAITIGLTVLVGIRMVRPLRTLTAAAEAGVRVPIKSSDEIGTLAAAFNEQSDRRERAEQQRQAMVGDIAHELRNPLTTIRGWLEGVEDGVVETDPAWVSSMLEEVLLLHRVVDDLRDLAAADAGELRLHPEVVRVSPLLDQIAATHRTPAIHLSVEVSGNAEVEADPVRLRQAVNNLVTNAIRHTPAGGSVTLSAHSADDGVVIEVTDTGPGIDAADLPLVFDRFWRAEKSRNRHTGGSGLGLAIVRQLIRAHGGEATVTSKPGRTTFTLCLPRRAGPIANGLRDALAGKL